MEDKHRKADGSEFLMPVPVSDMLEAINECRAAEVPLPKRLAVWAIMVDVNKGRVRRKRDYGNLWGWTRGQVQYRWKDTWQEAARRCCSFGRQLDSPLVAKLPPAWLVWLNEAYPATESTVEKRAESTCTQHAQIPAGNGQKRRSTCTNDAPYYNPESINTKKQQQHTSTFPAGGDGAAVSVGVVLNGSGKKEKAAPDSELVGELTERGVSVDIAKHLVFTYDRQQILEQIPHFDSGEIQSAGGLVVSIKKGWTWPSTSTAAGDYLQRCLEGTDRVLIKNFERYLGIETRWLRNHFTEQEWRFLLENKPADLALSELDIDRRNAVYYEDTGRCFPAKEGVDLFEDIMEVHPDAEKIVGVWKQMEQDGYDAEGISLRFRKEYVPQRWNPGMKAVRLDGKPSFTYKEALEQFNKRGNSRLTLTDMFEQVPQPNGEPPRWKRKAAQPAYRHQRQQAYA